MAPRRRGLPTPVTCRSSNLVSPVLGGRIPGRRRLRWSHTPQPPGTRAALAKYLSPAALWCGRCRGTGPHTRDASQNKLTVSERRVSRLFAARASEAYTAVEVFLSGGDKSAPTTLTADSVSARPGCGVTRWETPLAGVGVRQTCIIRPAVQRRDGAPGRRRGRQPANMLSDEVWPQPIIIIGIHLHPKVDDKTGERLYAGNDLKSLAFCHWVTKLQRIRSFGVQEIMTVSDQNMSQGSS